VTRTGSSDPRPMALIRATSRPSGLGTVAGGFYAKCDRCGGEVRAARPGRPGAPGRPRAGSGSRGIGAACR
jgi:hypothetical protein